MSVARCKYQAGTGGTDNAYRFGGAVGYYRDASNRLHIMARGYHPAGGRWLSRDPIGLTGGDANVYRYGNNNPLLNLDPLGLSCVDDFRYGDPNATAASATSTLSAGGCMSLTVQLFLYQIGAIDCIDWQAVDKYNRWTAAFELAATFGESHLQRGAARGVGGLRPTLFSPGFKVPQIPQPKQLIVDVTNKAVTWRLGTHLSRAAKSAELTEKRIADAFRNPGAFPRHRGTAVHMDFAQRVRDDKFLPKALVSVTAQWKRGPDVHVKLLNTWRDATTTPKEFGKKIPKYGAEYGKGFPLNYR